MELKWVKIGNEGPGPVFIARSVTDDRNRYEISGTEGFWYGTYIDLSRKTPEPGGPRWNLGWGPDFTLIKDRCQALEDYCAR